MSKVRNISLLQKLFSLDARGTSLPVLLKAFFLTVFQSFILTFLNPIDFKVSLIYFENRVEVKEPPKEECHATTIINIMCTCNTFSNLWVKK